MIEASEGKEVAARAPVSVGRRSLALVLAFCMGLGLAEVGLRYLLFSDSGMAENLSERWNLRRAGLWADEIDEDYWKLQRLFLPAEERCKGPNVYDPLLGWRSPSILENYDHERRASCAGKRPVLVYGASFVAKEFEELFMASDSADRYAFLTYAVGGYGPDQVLLLLQRSLPFFEGLDPVVVFGFVASGDFGRAALDLRTWPRPRSRVGADGHVRFEPEPVPHLPTFLEEHPVGIRSYVWAAIVHDFLPPKWRARLAGSKAKRDAADAMITAVVEDLDREVESRGLDSFYILFHNPPDMAAGGPRSYEERFVTQLLVRERIPFISSRPVLRAAAKLEGTSTKSYFVPPPSPHRGHLSARGTRVLLECFHRGLAGDFDRLLPERDPEGRTPR